MDRFVFECTLPYLQYLYSEIILDALSSVLSHNDLNLAPVLSNEEEKEEDKEEEEENEPSDAGEGHESTFVKQFLYFLIMTTLKAGYT